MCFGSACPDLHLPIPADSQILTPSTRPAVVTHTVMLPARRSACKIPSLENRHVWLSTAQSSPGPPNLARIAIMLPNLRNACDGVSGSATKIVDGPKHLIPFLFKPMSSQGADSHCVFALDFLSNLVYVVCIRYERFPEPRPTLRHRAQLPFPDYAALLGSMVPSRHSLGTFRHLRQGQLPLRSRGTA